MTTTQDERATVEKIITDRQKRQKDNDNNNARREEGLQAWKILLLIGKKTTKRQWQQCNNARREARVNVEKTNTDKDKDRTNDIDNNMWERRVKNKDGKMIGNGKQDKDNDNDWRREDIHGKQIY